MEKYLPAIFRFVRASVAVIVAGLAVQYGHNDLYLAIAPLILALDKFVRDNL
jgi:hypothetical protein